MLEKYINLGIIYPQDDKNTGLRLVALILTSLIPLFLLFSRAIADAALSTTGILFVIHCIRAKDYHYIKQPIIIVLVLLWLWFMVGSFFANANNIQAFLINFVYIRFI